MISLPYRAVLYPRDKVLLMGTPEQVRAGKRFSRTSRRSTADSPFEEVHMEAVAVPAGVRRRAVRGEVAPAKKFGVQLAGLHRAGVRILNPKQ